MAWKSALRARERGRSVINACISALTCNVDAEQSCERLPCCARHVNAIRTEREAARQTDDDDGLLVNKYVFSAGRAAAAAAWQRAAAMSKDGVTCCFGQMDEWINGGKVLKVLEDGPSCRHRRGRKSKILAQGKFPPRFPSLRLCGCFPDSHPGSGVERRMAFSPPRPATPPRPSMCPGGKVTAPRPAFLARHTAKNTWRNCDSVWVRVYGVWARCARSSHTVRVLT